MTCRRAVDMEWLQHNTDATRRFLACLGTVGYETEGDGRRTWTNVDWHEVSDFLADYRTFAGSTRFVPRGSAATSKLKQVDTVNWCDGRSRSGAFSKLSIGSATKTSG